MFQRLSKSFTKMTFAPPKAKPVMEPLENRQLFSAVDLGVLEVRTPYLPTALKVGAAPRGVAIVAFKNQGEDRFHGWVTFQLQLTADNQWHDDNPTIRTFKRYVAPLQMGQKRALWFALPSIPKGLIEQCNYHIAAKITVPGEDSAATANNTGAGWRTTYTGQPGIAKPKPSNPDPDHSTPDPEPEYVDLAVECVVSADRVEGTSQTTMTVTIRNVGTAKAQGTIAYDLSVTTEKIESVQNLFLEQHELQLDLASGEAMTFDELVTVPTTYTGPVYFKAKLADWDNVFNDTNVSNNTAYSHVVDVWHKNVDLSGSWTFKGGKTKLTTHANSKVKMHLELTNHGTDTYSGTVFIAIGAVATVNGLPLNSARLLRQDIPDLTIAGGETRCLVVEFDIPADLNPGKYNVTGFLNSNYNEGPLGDINDGFPEGLILDVGPSCSRGLRG